IRYGEQARTTEFTGWFFDGVPLTREPGGRDVGAIAAFRRWSLFGVSLEPVSNSGVVDWWRAQPLLAWTHQTNDLLWGARTGYLLPPDGDRVDTPGWKVVDSQSYRQNSYRRTGVNLRTLEGMVGHERFLRGMRAYSEQYRYGHPYPQEFFDAFCVAA